MINDFLFKINERNIIMLIKNKFLFLYLYLFFLIINLYKFFLNKKEHFISIIERNIDFTLH